MIAQSSYLMEVIFQNQLSSRSQFSSEDQFSRFVLVQRLDQAQFPPISKPSPSLENHFKPSYRLENNLRAQFSTDKAQFPPSKLCLSLVITCKSNQFKTSFLLARKSSISPCISSITPHLCIISCVSYPWIWRIMPYKL